MPTVVDTDPGISEIAAAVGCSCMNRQAYACRLIDLVNRSKRKESKPDVALYIVSLRLIFKKVAC